MHVNATQKMLQYAAMLQRAFIHLSLILLFAFTQMGVATHAISHLAEGHEQHQQDQNQHENQCGQCISLNHIANANTTAVFNFALNTTSHIYNPVVNASVHVVTPLSYTARAPPTTSQV